MRLLVPLVFVFSLLVPLGQARGEDAFPLQVIGQSRLTEAGLGAARDAAKQDAFRQALKDRLRYKLGDTLFRENASRLEEAVLEPAREFVVRSAVRDERQEGVRFTVTVDLELDREKLREALAASEAGVPRPKMALLWAVEERNPARPSATDTDTSKPRGEHGVTYLQTAWDEDPVPPSVEALHEELITNGHRVADWSPDTLAWLREALNGGEMNQALIRELGQRAEVRNVIFARLVRRELPTPPAAHFPVARVNHVAFLLDVAAGRLMGEPVISPFIEISADERATDAPREWIETILGRFEARADEEVRLTVRGLSSPGNLDAFWNELRAVPDLDFVSPRHITAEKVVFGLPGNRTPAYWADTIREAMPETGVNLTADGIEMTL